MRSFMERLFEYMQRPATRRDWLLLTVAVAVIQIAIIIMVH